LRGVQGKVSSNIGQRAGDKRHVVILLRPNLTTDCGARNEYIPFETADHAAGVTRPWATVEGLEQPADPPEAQTNLMFGESPLYPLAQRRRAAIEHLSHNPAPGEEIDGQRVVSQIRMDWVQGLTTEMRVRHLIEFQGTALRYVDYQIDAFADVDEQRRHLVMKCTRIQEHGLEDEG